MTASFLNNFKISDTDQLILALIFRIGVFLVKTLSLTLKGIDNFHGKYFESASVLRPLTYRTLNIDY